MAQLEAERRVPLNRDRVLRAAVALADEAGIDARMLLIDHSRDPTSTAPLFGNTRAR